MMAGLDTKPTAWAPRLSWLLLLPYAQLPSTETYTGFPVWNHPLRDGHFIAAERTVIHLDWNQHKF